jgi:sugar porter (SP) family MFS transporter
MARNTTLYLSALTAGLTAALFGYSVGFIGGIIVLPSFLSHFSLSHLPPSALASTQAQIITSWLLGALFGVPLGMPFCSRYGRKGCLFMAGGLYVLGAGMQLLDIGIEGFEVGRALNGLGVGVGTLGGPMYISEVSPPSKRGMLMSSYQTILQLSALAGFWGAFLSHSSFPSSSAVQWQLPTAIQLIPGLLLLFGTCFIPETPSFLASKGRDEEAERSLVRLRGAKGEEWLVEGEMQEIRDAACIASLLEDKKAPFFKEILKPGIRRRLVVGVGLMIAQNMVGLNALNYYAPVIFMSAGFTSVSASLFLTGVFGVVKLLSAIAFMFVFVKIRGNRFWLLLGSSLCGICMLVLAYFVAKIPPVGQQGEAKLTLGGVVSVLTVYIFAFSFSVSLGPISWNVCSEIFPLHINSKCCAITTCTQWLFQIVIAYITPHLLTTIGWGTYLLYALCCLLTILFVYFSVPETRNVPLGREMDALFDDEKDMDEEEEMEEETETTLLLKHGQRERRGSLGVYT